MDVSKNLRSAFEEILDKMAFLYFEDPEEGELPEAPSFDFMTQIRFRGVIQGCLNLFFVRETAEQIARNLVGIREEDDLFGDTMEDAILEFTNMVMGRTMTNLDPDHGFEMEVPQVVAEPSSGGEGEQTVSILGTLDDQPCKILIHFRAAA